MSPQPQKDLPLAPYPVWIAMTGLARVSQILFIGGVIWGIAALFDALDKSMTIGLPPFWLFLPGLIFGVKTRGQPAGKTSPICDLIGNRLASQVCPACGQNVFDHSGPTGYAPPQQRQRLWPLKHCANCGHDLTLRDAR